jgi:hypothetical protein
MTTQYKMAYPKFKVFIFGVEVTADVTGITASYHDGGAPNTCQITLLNELDKYIVTTSDLISLNGLSDKNVVIPWLNGSSPIGATSIDSSFAPASISINNTISSDKYLSINAAKRSVLERKVGIIANTLLQSDERLDPRGQPITQPSFANYFGSDIHRYPLADGAPIFHAMDQVRVFMRDPFNPARWYHHFAGFISDMVDNTNDSNTKTLTILVEDVTKLFRYSRVFINPGIVDAKTIIQDTDLRVQSFYSNFLHGLSLPEMLFTLIFGPDKAGNEKLRSQLHAVSGSSSITTRLRGIGHFDFNSSGIFTFGNGPSELDNTTYGIEKKGSGDTLFNVKPATHIAELRTWEAIIDHEVHQSDLFGMLSEAQKDMNGGGEVLAADIASTLPTGSDGLLDIEAVVEQIGRRPDLYPVDGGKLYILLPEGFGAGNSELLTKEVIQSYPMESEWHSAGEIIMACIERIQFCMYSTPKGDIVIEPPLYDFDPDDFGMQPIGEEEYKRLVESLQKNAKSSPSEAAGTMTFLPQDYGHLQTLQVADALSASNQRGPFGPSYIILKADTYSWESAIIDEKVHTIATCSANIFANYESLGSMALVGQIIVVKLPELIPLYGSRQLSAVAPGYVETSEAAHVYASLMLNRQNADAHTMRVTSLPNIKLRINRPIYIEGRNCIATTKQITQSITWGQQGDMATTVDLYATRTWNGQISTDNPPMPIYTPIGGYVSAAINYATYFKKRSPPVLTDSKANVPAAGPAYDFTAKIYGQ